MRRQKPGPRWCKPLGVWKRKFWQFGNRQQQEDGTFSSAKNAKMSGVSALVVGALAACGEDYLDVKNPDGGQSGELR